MQLFVIFFSRPIEFGIATTLAVVMLVILLRSAMSAEGPSGLGRMMSRPSRDGPSADIAERRRIRSIRTVIAVEMPNSTGRWKKMTKSCTRALAGGWLRSRSCWQMLADDGVRSTA